jgi:putative membrane protein
VTDRSPSTPDEPDGPTEPDPRVTYANERTMLAWIRTALALMTAGLAITQLLPAFRFAGGRRVIGLPLIALGIWAAAAGYRQWDANERAIRAGRPVPRSRLVATVTGGVVVVSAIALVLAAVGGVPK